MLRVQLAEAQQTIDSMVGDKARQSETLQSSLDEYRKKATVALMKVRAPLPALQAPTLTPRVFCGRTAEGGHDYRASAA